MLALRFRKTFYFVQPLYIIEVINLEKNVTWSMNLSDIVSHDPIIFSTNFNSTRLWVSSIISNLVANILEIIHLKQMSND